MSLFLAMQKDKYQSLWGRDFFAIKSMIDENK